MEEIHTIIKIAVEKNGNNVFATTEKAFRNKEEAIAYCKANATMWEELIGGTECQCERGIHTTVLT